MCVPSSAALTEQHLHASSTEFPPAGASFQDGSGLQCEALRNVLDGPIMWKLEAPAGYTSGVLVRLNEIALIPAVLVFLRHGQCPVRLPFMPRFDA